MDPPAHPDDPPVPGWVKALGVAALLAALAVVGLHLATGGLAGLHGP